MQHFKGMFVDLTTYASVHSLDTGDPTWIFTAWQGILEEQLALGWEFVGTAGDASGYGQPAIFRAVGQPT